MAAAWSGAETLTLDLSKRYLEWARENLLLNGLDPALQVMEMAAEGEALAAGDTAFVSFAVGSNGLASVTLPFIVQLHMDGEELGQWIASDGLALGTWLPVEDFPVLAGAGPHTLVVTIDQYDLIAEADETDNLITKTYDWITGEPVLRLSPAHISKTITPLKSRSAALALVSAPLLKREVNLPVISPILAEAMANKATDDKLRVMIVPAERLDAPAMNLALKDASRATRREVISLAAKNQVDQSHTLLSGTLNRLLTSGRADAPQPLWLSGTLLMEMTASAVADLADDPAVGYLYLDQTRSETFGGPVPITYRDPTVSPDKANAWHLAAIGADQVWADGVTGTGIVVGHLDSGVAYDHPDLIGQMWDGGAEFPHPGYDTVADDDDP